MSEPTNTTSEELVVDDGQKVINDDQFYIIRAIYVSLTVPLSCVGVVANSFNILVFVTMGINDTVGVNFLSLSVLDFGVTVFSALAAAWSGVVIAHSRGIIQLRMDSRFVRLLLINNARALTMGSSLLTMYMSVQRCCCVVLPFRFREVFTKRRAVYIVCLVGLFPVTFIALYGTFYRLDEVTLPGSNLTVLKVGQREHRAMAMKITTWVRFALIHVGPEVVVIFCSGIMAAALRKSSQFKKNLTKSGPGERHKQVDSRAEGSDPTPQSSCFTQKGRNAQPQGSVTTQAVSSSKKAPLSSSSQVSTRNEVRALKTMYVIATVFALCNMPAAGIEIARLIPGFDHLGRFRNVYLMASYVKSLCESLCSTINIFVYLQTNTKFKDTFQRRFYWGAIKAEIE